MSSRTPGNANTTNNAANNNSYNNSGNNSTDYSAIARPSTYIAPHCRELLTPAKLDELINQIAPGERLDKEVEEFLQEHVDEFVDSVTEYACRIAKHRNGRTVEARDFQVHLQNKWNIRVPGYGDDPRPPAKRNVSAPVHNARMQAIAKSQQQQQQQLQLQQQQQLAQQQLQMQQTSQQDGNVNNSNNNNSNPTPTNN